MKASQLRDLTRRYATGQISRDEYVAERTRLIDGIVAGSIELRHRDLGPPPASTANGARHGWFAGGTALLLALLLFALLAYFLDDGENTKPGGDQTAVTANPPNPGGELLRAFVGTNEWSNDALQRLEADWALLTPFEKENARRSVWFRRLRHETERRVGEQETLLAAGEMEALLRAGRLREFSARLGLGD